MHIKSQFNRFIQSSFWHFLKMNSAFTQYVFFQHPGSGQTHWLTIKFKLHCNEINFSDSLKKETLEEDDDDGNDDVQRCEMQMQLTPKQFYAQIRNIFPYARMQHAKKFHEMLHCLLSTTKSHQFIGKYRHVVAKLRTEIWNTLYQTHISYLSLSFLVFTKFQVSIWIMKFDKSFSLHSENQMKPFSTYIIIWIAFLSIVRFVLISLTGGEF